MEKKHGILAVVPAQRIVPLLFAFACNMAVYAGARVIAGEWKHYDIESPLDGLVPLWTPSAAVYLGCYLFWAVNYIIMARQEKEDMCRFFAADVLSRLVCFTIYLVFPTTNTRPVIEPDGFWNRVMLFVYEVDAADNLFPSIHCLVSWFCYIGLRGREQVPKWYRGTSCVLSVLVCISTLTTKQHVMIDVAGGILLAEVCYQVAKNPVIWKSYGKALDFINKRLFTKGNMECRVKRKQ